MGYEWVFIGSFLTHSNYPPIYLLAPTRLYPTLTRPYQTLIDPNRPYQTLIDSNRPYQTLIDPNPTLTRPYQTLPAPLKSQKPAAFLPRALFLALRFYLREPQLLA